MNIKNNLTKQKTKNYFKYDFTFKDFLYEIYKIYDIYSLNDWIDNNVINNTILIPKHTVSRIINYFLFDFKDEIKKNNLLFSNILINIFIKQYNKNINIKEISKIVDYYINVKNDKHNINDIIKHIFLL